MQFQAAVLALLKPHQRLSIAANVVAAWRQVRA